MLLFAATGMKGGSLGSKEEQTLIDAGYHYATQLKLNRFRGIVEIRVPRKRGYIDKCVGGYCSADRWKFNDGKNYWIVSIDLARLRKGEMLKNLAHEMIHAKQFLRKELAIDMNTWKGVVFHSEKDDGFYLDSPWEKEAYGMETSLYNSYINGDNYVK